MSAFQSDDDLRPIFSRGPLLALKLLALLLVAGGALAFQLKTTDGKEELSPVRQALATALSPIYWLADLPQDFYQLGEHFQHREKLIADNRHYRHEQLRLNARLQKLSALEAENQRLRAMLQSSKDIHQNVVIADVDSAHLDAYRHHIRLGKGLSDGIEVGQAVIDAKGILGQVIEVSPQHATAILITDENQGIPVEVNRNALQTVAHGLGDGYKLKLPYLPSNADIQVGDLLVSSGMGGRYPANYPVAYVESIDHQPGEHFLQITASPIAQIGNSREILLVQDSPANVSTASLIENSSSEQVASNQ